MSRVSSLARKVLPGGLFKQARTLKGRFLALRYAGARLYCPICDSSFDKFLPAGDPGRERDNARCPRCDSLERHRLLWLFLQREINFFGGPRRILHFAPERCFEERISRLENIHYVTADLDPSLVMMGIDITAIPFPDSSFDLILCSHVLEHVPDDFLAMRELHRVITRDGMAIIMVPTVGDITVEGSPGDTAAYRRQHFGQTDHVRLYGSDIRRRLEESGFEVDVVNYADHLEADLVRRARLVMEHSWYDTREPIFVSTRST